MILALALFCAAATAPAAAPVVSSIVIEVSGRNTTEPGAVRRLMNTQEGVPLDPVKLENDLLRLRATSVLYEVSAEQEEEDDGTRLTVKVRDRWSLLPVFGLRRGGGRTTTRLGISERNALGKLLQIYGEFTSSSDIPFQAIGRIGSYLGLVAPRINGSPFSAAIFWQREFLDFTGWGRDFERAAVYDRNRHLVRAEARWELSDLVTAAITGTVFNDSYAANDASPAKVTLPGRARTAALSAELSLGLVDDRVTSLRGSEARFALEGARAGLVSDFSFIAATASLRSFFIPRAGHNLGLQIVAQATTARDDSHLFRAGGLLEIRGFPDAFFLGQRLVRANLEHRIELFRPTLFLPTAIQAVGFVEGGFVSGRADAIAGSNYEGPIASAGGGLRIVVIPLTRAVIRVDVASGLWPTRTLDISVGGQQFF